MGIVARDPGRGEATAAEIARTTGNDRVGVSLADLSSQGSIRDLARSFRDAHDR